MKKRGKNALDYLNDSAEKYSDKEAYEDKNTVMTFGEMKNYGQIIGSTLADNINAYRKPVAVFLDKSVQGIAAFFGVIYSGNFYCPLDTKMPYERIRIIMEVLEPAAIITDREHKEQAGSFSDGVEIFVWEDLITNNINFDKLSEIYNQMTEYDPLYVLFTSGSTGIPKGVLVGNRVVTNYLEWLDEKFDIDENDVFGNQAPFYFDVSIHDIFGTVYFGAKMVIIPKGYFGFPVRLIEYMNLKHITTFLWVPSAMSIVANLKTFDVIKPKYLKYIMFAGEVLQRKQLDYWVENIPDAVYANLYGPTETYVCTAYIMNGNEKEEQPLPIGKPVSNSQALILNDECKEVKYGEVGELCMRGSCLAIGYYNNINKTNQSFVQNPLHNSYPDRIYHTGDLVRYDENGDLVYISRKDFLIKHMGYRIELGEIETVGNTIDEIRDCACLYDNKRKKIVFFYDGKEMDAKVLVDKLAEKVPQYMIPGKFIYLDAMPHNANGKIDRVKLKDCI